MRTAAENLDNLFPSKLDLWLTGTHPPIIERIEVIEKIMEEQPELLKES